MSRKKSLVLTDHELRLMEVLWRRGRASVADVVESLAPPPLAYSTVLTTLRTLEQKGYIDHEEDGRDPVGAGYLEVDEAKQKFEQHLESEQDEKELQGSKNRERDLPQHASQRTQASEQICGGISRW